MRPLGAILVVACSSSAQVSRTPEVKIWGALREMIHDGRTEARVQIARVVEPRIYGLGALAGMRGEVTVLDGEAWIALGERDRGRASVGASDEDAALVVTARVPAWRRVETAIPFELLDARIEEYAAAAGLATDIPFPFVIEGEVDARWHVLNGPPAPGANPHDHASNAVVGSHAGAATVVAFFSKKHQGVFTHMGQNVHAHLLVRTSALASHADELSIRAGSSLLLPN